EIWKNQQDYNLISWRLFDSCRVHVLLMNTGVAIHIMIEKKYPLIQEMLSRMLNRRLEVDYESEMAFELLIFIKSQLQKSPVLWAKIRESSLIRFELVQETTDKVVLIKEKLKATRDRQKSCVDNRRKPLEFEADASLHVPLDEIKVDKTFRFVKEPVENSDREVKRLKCSRMVVVKVHLGSKRESENLDITTIVTPSNVKTDADRGISNTVESNVVRMYNISAPIIEDWNSDDESEIDYTIEPSIEKIRYVKTVKETNAAKQNPRGNQRN
ncbi:hypothetical protein Tco_1051701, partial [Tanacetum coccineum]